MKSNAAQNWDRTGASLMFTKSNHSNTYAFIVRLPNSTQNGIQSSAKLCGTKWRKL